MLSKIYNECATLLPSFRLNKLEDSASLSITVTAMAALLRKIKSEFQSKLDSATRDEIDIKLSMLEDYVVFPEDDLIAIFNNVLEVIKTLATHQKNHELPAAPPPLNKKIIFKRDNQITQELIHATEEDLKKKNLKGKGRADNGIGSVITVELLNFYDAYVGVATQYSELECVKNSSGSSSGSSSSSSSSSSTVIAQDKRTFKNKTEIINALMKLTRKMSLMPLKDFVEKGIIDGKVYANLVNIRNKIQLDTSGEITLFHEYALTLSNALGFNYQNFSTSSTGATLTQTWNNVVIEQVWDNAADNKEDKLDAFSSLYQKYVKAEKDYIKIINAQALAEGKNHIEQPKLPENRPESEDMVLKTLLAFVKNLNLEPVLNVMEERGQEILSINYAITISLDETVPKSDLYNALLKNATVLRTLLSQQCKKMESSYPKLHSKIN